MTKFRIKNVDFQLALVDSETEREVYTEDVHMGFGPQGVPGPKINQTDGTLSECIDALHTSTAAAILYRVSERVAKVKGEIKLSEETVTELERQLKSVDA